MGFLAWNMEDAVREGDGERIIRLWKFFLLHFKQAGKTIYSLEALRLIYNVQFGLSEKLAHVLTYNRTCNARGGIGCNVSLDLHMEHLNRNFKDDINTFAPHLSESSVEKTAHATPVVNEYIAHFDKLVCIPQDSGLHIKPSEENDRKAIFDLFMETEACSHIPGRAYIHYKGFSSHLYRNLREPCKWENFTNWIDCKLKEFSAENKYKQYKKSQRGMHAC